MGKIADSSTFVTLKIYGGIAINSNQNTSSCNNSFTENRQDHQKRFYDDANNDAMELADNPIIDIGTIKNKWTAHSIIWT